MSDIRRLPWICRGCEKECAIECVGKPDMKCSHGNLKLTFSAFIYKDGKKQLHPFIEDWWYFFATDEEKDSVRKRMKEFNIEGELPVDVIG